MFHSPYFDFVTRLTCMKRGAVRGNDDETPISVHPDREPLALAVAALRQRLTDDEWAAYRDALTRYSTARSYEVACAYRSRVAAIVNRRAAATAEAVGERKRQRVDAETSTSPPLPSLVELHNDIVSLWFATARGLCSSVPSARALPVARCCWVLTEGARTHDILARAAIRWLQPLS